jgi:stage IV sporulation protein FB
MLFVEPPPSPYDLRFSMFGIPVRVHPWFWLVGLILARNGPQMIGVLLRIVALFVAILVHELGHALVMRRYGLRPWITLQQTGGLTSYDPSRLAYSRANAWTAQILISLAGAGAGFVLAALLVAALVVSGHSFHVFVGVNAGPVLDVSLREIGVRMLHDIPLVGLQAEVGNMTSPVTRDFVEPLLFVTIVWGLVNLLPVYPLDGGQIAREVFLRFNPRVGIRNSLIFSTAVAGLLAAAALAMIVHRARVLAALGGSPSDAFRGASLFVAILFGYLAYSSYATLQAYTGSRPRW